MSCWSMSGRKRKEADQLGVGQLKQRADRVEFHPEGGRDLRLVGAAVAEARRDSVGNGELVNGLGPIHGFDRTRRPRSGRQ